MTFDFEYLLVYNNQNLQQCTIRMKNSSVVFYNVKEYKKVTHHFVTMDKQSSYGFILGKIKIK